jgi:hypothetical protein
MLLAELDHRNIRLHERVTENLVSQRYKFGKLLGQGSSATVFEAKHKKTGREVAIKVIKKDDDMNDDESMATELEILKTVHHRCAAPPPTTGPAPTERQLMKLPSAPPSRVRRRSCAVGTVATHAAADAASRAAVRVRQVHPQLPRDI